MAAKKFHPKAISRVSYFVGHNADHAAVFYFVSDSAHGDDGIGDRFDTGVIVETPAIRRPEPAKTPIRICK